MSDVGSRAGKRVSFHTEANQILCESLFASEDAHLRRLRAESEQKGLPPIAISPSDGQVIRLLLSLLRVERAVEIGTLGGYSATWIARAMISGGRLDCFEIDPERAAFAQNLLDDAGLNVTVKVHDGPAMQGLKDIKPGLDFVFIDADKGGYAAYLDWAAENLRSGGIVALDNAFAWGGLADPAVLGDRRGEADAVRTAVERLVNDPRWRVRAMLPTNEGLAVGIRA